jgi:hypothetical protein
MSQMRRKSAVAAGVFFIVAAIAAVAGLLLYGPALSDPNYIVGSGSDTRVSLGAFCEVILAISVLGTAATLYPILRKQNEAVGLGYVLGRLVEGIVIVVGIVSVVSIVTLRQGAAGAAGTDAASLVTAGKALVAFHNWTLLFGPNFALGANTTLLAYVMYRSGLVPRLIAVLGLIGGPVIFVSAIAVLFGVYAQVSTMGALTALPVSAWELSLSLWLIFKGFKPSPILFSDTRDVGVNRSVVPAAADR